MAFTEELLDPGPQLPPQATTGLPAMAAELGNIASAPTQTEALLQASFGDRGAQAYQNLQAANQQAAYPAAAVPAPATAPMPAAAPSGLSQFAGGLPGPSGIADILTGTLAGIAKGDPYAGQKQFLIQQQAQRQAAAATQVAASADMDFYKKLHDLPLPHRAGFAADYFRKQGRQVPPSVLNALSDTDILAKMTDPEVTELVNRDPYWKHVFLNSVKDPEAFLEFQDKIKQQKAQTTTAELTTKKAEADFAGGPEAPKSPYAGHRAAAIDALKREGNPNPSEAEIDERVGYLAASAKAPPMTIQRAREQIGSARNVAGNILTLLDDPKYADAKKKLGPNLTTTIAGVSVGAPQFNFAWRNYKQFGGQGNTSETNRLMEAIGYYQGTGFQGFLAGIRNEKVINDIRTHIPQPFDTEETIKSKIGYLQDRYTDVLAEFAKGGKPIGVQEPGTEVSPPSTAIPTATDADSFLKKYGL